VVPKATVSLLGTFDQPIRTEVANDASESVWTDLPLGFSRLRATAPGFKSRLLTVTITKRKEQMLDARLEVDCIEECVPELNPDYIPYSDSLDLTASPPPRHAKRKWWQIFY
jgi:hypothetical protein